MAVVSSAALKADLDDVRLVLVLADDAKWIVVVIEGAAVKLLQALLCRPLLGVARPT